MTRYLVTGGAGFIGSALARLLLGQGHEVRILDRFSSPKQHRIPPGADARAGDVRDALTVEAVADGCDSIIHLAYPQGRTAHPLDILHTAAIGTLNVLAACDSQDIGELLLVSSPLAYHAAPVPTPETVPLTVPDPLNPRYAYGAGKILSEVMAGAQAGTMDRMIIARPHNVYGPDMGREHVIPQFITRMTDLCAAQPEGVIAFPVRGTGQETRSFCWIADCAAQLGLLLAKGSTGIYNVGTMDEHSIGEVAMMIADCYGREIKVVPATAEAAAPLRRVPDMAQLRKLGLGSFTPLEAGLPVTVEWYRAHG